MDVHIGKKISEVLVVRGITKGELGGILGMTGSGGTYLTTRASIDVDVLAKISNALEYNFFKLYPVKEKPFPGEEFQKDERDKKIDELNGKISELQKQLDDCKRDLIIQQNENGYLKKINELTEKLAKKG